MDIFKLAEQQLYNELVNRKREQYNLSNVIDYAIRIRKWIDNQGGDIKGIVHQLSYTDKEIRHNRYIQTGK